MATRGIKVDPENRKEVRFLIYLTQTQHEFVREYSHENRTYMSNVIRSLIDNLMDDRKILNNKNWR